MAPPSKPDAALGKLPRDFVSLREVLENKNRVGSFASVIGVVIDSRAPMKTSRDWKTTLRIIDKSMEDSGDLETDSVDCIFFMAEDEMPKVECGDIVVLVKFRTQMFRGQSTVSLLTNYESSFSIFRADKIPKPPGDASKALVPGPASRRRKATEAELMPELKYVAYLHHNINRERIPTKEEFKTMQLQSLNVKEKFRELKDVTDGVFADLVVRLVSEPHFMGDKATIWVSDYTENPAFFNFTAIGTNDGDFHDGDAFGYTSKNLKKQQAKKRQGQDTRGPFGKRKMQITCWDPHTSAIRQEDIKRGTWVEMKNVQIKYGNNGANLEGFLREDRKAHGIKIGIFALEIDDRDYMSEKLVNAIKRHRDYDRSKKAQLDDIQDAALAGQKRKRQLEAGKTTTAPNGENAKVRRQKQRAEQKGKKAKAEKNMGDGNTEAAPVQAPAAPEPPQPKPPANLNTQVKCENQFHPANTVSSILKHPMVEADVGGRSVGLALPFYNANHRVDVRVTDFRPHDLRKFSYRAKVSNFAVLSDDGSSQIGSDRDSDAGNSLDIEADDDDMYTDGNWEWRFALELEDATTGIDEAERARFWVVVDNQAAQCLTNQDAVDLSEDPDSLETLRQRMFLLWGELEEKKAQEQQNGRADGPPPDSDDEAPATKGGDKQQPKQQKHETNLPFSCCVRQFGIKVPEADQNRADAGDGQRWMRVFGLYGTRII